MNKENKTILLNQLRIMSAMQRLEYFVHQEEILEDLSEGIKDTQKILSDDIDNKISIKQKNINLKQALNEIKEYIYQHELVDRPHEYVINGNIILQIIDKVGGNEQ